MEEVSALEREAERGYCSVDDSFRDVFGKGLPDFIKGRDTRKLPSFLSCKRMDTYVSSMYAHDVHIEEAYNSLIFVKPARSPASERLIYDFVTDFLEGCHLIACLHYKQYQSLVSLPSVEFVNRPKRKERGYPQFKKDIFYRAHKECTRVSKEVRDALVRAKHWDYMVDALREGAETVEIKGLEIHLAGFYQL